MNAKTSAYLSLLLLSVGIAVGIGADRSSWFARAQVAVPGNVSGRATQPNFRGVLSRLLRDSQAFILTGVEAYGTHCNVAVTAVAIRDDYLVVKEGSGLKRYLPFSAIYRVDSEGPGPVTIPMVYSTAFPQPHLCGN